MATVEQRSAGPDNELEELLHAVSKATPKSVGDPHRASFQAFIPLFFQSVPLQDLVEESAEDLNGAALSHWEYAQRRPAGSTLLRVFNPTFETHGWQSAHTIVELVTDDQPHLVTSLQSALVQAGNGVHLIIHPILDVTRDGEGRATAIDGRGKGGDQAISESMIRIEIDRAVDDQIEGIQYTLECVLSMLNDVRSDREAMLEQLNTLTVPDMQEEHIAFVRWLDDRQFACLGIGSFSADPRTGLTRDGKIELGVFNASRDDSCWSIGELISEEIQTGLTRISEPLVLAQGNRRSPIIRNDHVQLVLLLERDTGGQLVRLFCVAGLFVPGLQNEAIASTPWLRERFNRVIEGVEVAADSHDGKALASTLRGFPRDMLLQMPAAELRDMAIRIIALHERQQIRLFSSTDALGNFCNCLVYIPRDAYSRSLRLKIENILTKHIDGTSAEFHVRFASDSSLARLHFVVHKRPPMNRDINWHDIESRIRQAAVTWDHRLSENLHAQYDEATALALYKRYRRAFPANYREDYSARSAVADIDFIEHHLVNDAPVMSSYRHVLADSNTINFKLFSVGNPVFLSDVMPLIENMGLRIEAEHPFDISRKDDSSVWIHEFTVQHTGSGTLDADTSAARVQEAFGHIWRRNVEDDGFNRLILDAGLTWQQIVMLRSYCKYLLQIKVPFSQAYMIDSLVANQAITSLLVQLFEQRFDPAKSATSDNTIEASIEAALDGVDSLDQDRILRAYLNVIQSTLRTNFYVGVADGKRLGYVSYKIDSAAIANLPLPRPMVEVFVYSPRVEGIHLRGGKVARGGLRWSDRREDFRTEVLGLMKAQMVKNAVIVPVGSKGGFYVKAALANDRETAMKTVVDCYQTFLKGLLDLTDNIVNGKVVPPVDVVRHDPDDPYLVVAADKGTATFSDFANAVSQSYGFWLGDAFASGGSAGYDHKKMGITARGAWESVKRHFRQLGHDTQTEPFTVVGIGDMAGDVFGNGMLLSEQIRLVAAFNHMHIFIDPDPDPATTFAERARLFELPRSSWTDYNTDLISAGGGIFSRADKKITLSEQAQQALGIDEATLTPTDLINLIIKAPVDLLWNGGIGTYVKASSETHADAADRANDAVRVNGRDLRARVVGEGGNLGVTQLGRIEFARQGGLIYTDAIDNSAGVDCSDHEVNIKILLNAVVAADDMTLKQRDRLLVDMTKDVARLVLDDNYLQTQCIDLTHRGGSHALDEQARFMTHLETIGRLDRQIEYLPDAEEVADLLAAERGLSRPQLAVLVSYSKMVMYDELMSGAVTDEAALEKVLIEYFPAILGTRYLEQIRGHRLRREIIATLVTNEFVNRLGPTFAFRMQQELGATTADIAAAFMAVRSIFHMPELWQAIEMLDNKVPADIQYQMQVLVTGLVERATHWLLRTPRKAEGIEQRIARFESGIGDLMQAMPGCLASANRDTLDQRVRFFSDAGVPAETADRVAEVVPLSSSLDVVEIADSVEQPVGTVAAVYFALGQDLDLQWMRERIGELRVTTQWHTLAKSELRSDLHNQQRSLCAEVARSTDPAADAEARVATWRNNNSAAISKYANLMTDLRASSSVDFAMLSLAVNEVHKLSRVSDVKLTA